MTLSKDKQLLYDLFQAYFDARKNKRNTINALSFEIDFERKVFKLYQEIKERKYKIGPSICFVVKEPMIREVFAADFRDRVIHHLVYNYIGPIFERFFINDSYSCRLGKGTSYGIKRVDHFIRSCSYNYQQDCYILKLDVKGYFMSIDRIILYQQVKKTLDKFKDVVIFDYNLVLWLVRKIIFYEPTKSCIIRGTKNDWQHLPKSKSLFWAGKNKGLPIGNLTSQLFGNVYLNSFDHFIKHKLGCKYYGRYVDDLVIVHQDKKYLKLIIFLLKKYLQDNLFLELHPKKIYFQHFSKGVSFLGTIIKPYRIYISNRVKGNFYKKLKYWNNLSISIINSYLGIMKHYNTYNLRQKILNYNFIQIYSKI